MEDLQPLLEEKFGEFVPSLSKLRSILEEVRHQANSFLNTKLETDPDEPAADAGWGASEEEAPVEDAEPEEAAHAVSSSGAAAAPARAKARPKGSLAAEPVDREDAIERVASAARFWRTEDPYSPAPYLMLRGMRWGELRAAEALDPSTFEAPNSETRTSLKRLLTEGSYAEAIEMAESAMASPAGRAWLDLQRYVVTAAENLGYTAIAEAIKAELAALLKTFPDLKTSSLMDDTPCANNDTVEWLNGFAEDSASAPAPIPVWEPRYEESETESASGEEGREGSGCVRACDGGGPIGPAAGCVRDPDSRSCASEFGTRPVSTQAAVGADLPVNRTRSRSHSRFCRNWRRRSRGTNWKNGNRLIWWRMRLHSYTGVCQTAAFLRKRKKTLYSKICRLDPLQALANSR